MIKVKSGLERRKTLIPTAEIAREASGLYREQQILQKTDELTAAGASQEVIDRELEEIRQAPDVIARSYLSEMLSGGHPNPPFAKIVALGLYFGVSTDYFAVGAAATEATKKAEQEVELVGLVSQFANHLDTESDGSGTALVGALMRGGVQTDPRQVQGMILMALAAMGVSPEKHS
ncbi:hypothetical protein ACPCSE_29575 [Streptomyces cellulosae]